MDIDQVLHAAIEMGASDIHIVSDHPPMVRVHTAMTPMTDFGQIKPEDSMQMFRQIANEEQLERFEKIKDVDFSYQVKGMSRFRVNVHMQKRSVAIYLRAIKEDIPPLEALTLPPIIEKLTYLPRGLVLVTGDTGSGKSTTLAAMIQQMNQRYHKHVITVEDPTEYLFVSDKCTIEQRELGDDVPSFASGLRHVLRQDPDIILVGGAAGGDHGGHRCQLPRLWRCR